MPAYAGMTTAQVEKFSPRSQIHARIQGNKVLKSPNNRPIRKYLPRRIAEGLAPAYI